MRNKISTAPHSSKNLNFTSINDINNKSKLNLQKSSVQENNKINKLINNFQHNLPNIAKNKVKENEPNIMRSKNLKYSHISLYNPLMKNNNSFYQNYLFIPKNNLKKNKLSALDDSYRRRSKNSIMDAKNNYKVNLKLIEKELQFKLFDMSIQIENDNFLKKDDTDDFLDIKNENNNNIFSNYELEGNKNEIINIGMQSVNKNEINYIYSLNNINNTNQNLSFANISDIKGNQESNINKLGIIINKNKNSFSKED